MTSSNENAEQSPSEKETNVDERFHIKMKSLMTELQLDGKMLLACAWTTIEESRRFKIAPWVSTWDVVDGLNSEARPFFVGLNVDPNRESNVHTNTFLPSCQM